MATFPTVAVELEFAARIVEANFILNTGQLDSPTTGHLSSGWADVSDRVRQLDIKRGRQHELDRVESGTLTLTLRNNDRALDPLYTGSPYYPNITPMRRVRVMVTWNSVTYQLFNGYIERWPVKRTNRTDAEVTVDATDALALLEQANLDNVYGAALPGARLAQILDDAGWPAARRQLDIGTVMLDDALLEGSGTSVLQHALDVGETELGTVFCDGDGDLVFFDRHHRNRPPYTNSQAIFAAELDQIVFPEQSGNVVQNPSFEVNTNGWAGLGLPVGAAISRDTGTFKFGAASCKVVCPTGAPTVPGDGVYMNTAATCLAATLYTASLWVLAPAGTKLYLRVTDLIATEYVKVPFVASGVWQQVSATVTTNTNTTISVQLYCDLGQSPVTFWIDGAQVAAPSLTAYADGDQPNCRWAGAKHASATIYGGQFAYTDLSPSFDCDRLYNDIALTVASDPEPALASDQASIDQYWRRTLPRSTLLADWDEAQQMALELLRRYKDATPRVDALTLKPSGPLFDQVLARELGDRITVIDNPAGPGAPTVIDAHIEGIQHTVSGFKWITTWQVTSALEPEGSDFWTLNDATNGRLDYGQLVDY